MNTSEALLTLTELLEQVGKRLAGLTLPDRRASLQPDGRMVRYYTSLGLLAPPQIVQRQARYTAGHAADLLLIKLLQGRGLSLAAIQQQFTGLPAPARQDWLRRLEAEAPTVAPPPAVTWQEYTLAPGLRLQLHPDFTSRDLEATLRQIQTVLHSHLARRPSHDAD
ncbi:MAG: MerR family transcriptional regulator [Candidatus Sericytochromatia bacterium]